MQFLLSLPGKIAVAALALSLSFLGGTLYGKKLGRVEQLKDTVKAYETRTEVDQKIESMDRYGQCLALGGLPDQCDELRRVEEDTASQ